jgi:thiosulfate/3-mercaptopyruvate sulfurtransferase
MKPIISPADLLALSKENVILIDARSGSSAKENYESSHLEGALWVDLEQDLSEKTGDAAQGGRHPLPPVAKFAHLLGKLGITLASHVVVYDDKNGANAAARFWWMLRAVGHQKVQVLDGGYNAALDAGFPISSNPEAPNPTWDYPVDEWQLPIADIDEVAQAAQAMDAVVIDVREPGRYAGQFEPIDLVAGHIPGAINIPFASNLDANGFYLSPAELKTKYTESLDGVEPEKVIVHCGSGVTACHTLLAMAQAGMDIPKLYVGSWSEWSRNERPIATEEE